MITVNEYFDGAVKSLGYQTNEGKSTVGVMEEGEYKFGILMILQRHQNIRLQ